MNCMSCARSGSDRTAVALCPRCQAGLCLPHVQEAASRTGPGGTNLSCGHHTWETTPQHAQNSGPQKTPPAPHRTAAT